MEHLKIIYKGKEYLWEELIKETQKFTNDLKLPQEFLLDSSVRDFRFFFDFGYGIADYKFHDIFSVLASARFALINSHTKIHRHGVSWESGYFSQLWLRSQYLLNAILWYNSCEDYFLQTIWFAFEFYEDLTNYPDQMTKCNYKNVQNKLAPYKHLPNCKVLYDTLNAFHGNENIRYLRGLANNIKHKQFLRFTELDEKSNIEVLSGGIKSSSFEAEHLDLDATIDKIKNAHIEIVNFGFFLLEYIDFPAMFIFRDKDVIEMGERKNKREYKKLSVFDGFGT